MLQLPPVAKGRQALRELLVGKNKGIQGENNSCFIDATLMALFAAQSNFDSLFFPAAAATKKEGSSTIDELKDDPEISFIRQCLVTFILRPLRLIGYVERHQVMSFRSALHTKCGGSKVDFSSTCGTEDVGYFLKQLAKLCRWGASQLDPFASIESVLSRGPRRVCTTADLIAQLNPDSLSGQPAFLLDVPRSERNERQYPCLIPSTTVVVRDRVYLLRSVILIETSHYRSMLRIGTSSVETRGVAQEEWLLCDSMMDRGVDWKGSDCNISQCDVVDLSLFHIMSSKPRFLALWQEMFKNTTFWDQFLRQQARTNPFWKAVFVLLTQSYMFVYSLKDATDAGGSAVEPVMEPPETGRFEDLIQLLLRDPKKDWQTKYGEWVADFYHNISMRRSSPTVPIGDWRNNNQPLPPVSREMHTNSSGSLFGVNTLQHTAAVVQSVVENPIRSNCFLQQSVQVCPYCSVGIMSDMMKEHSRTCEKKIKIPNFVGSDMQRNSELTEAYAKVNPTVVDEKNPNDKRGRMYKCRYCTDTAATFEMCNRHEVSCPERFACIICHCGFSTVELRNTHENGCCRPL